MIDKNKIIELYFIKKYKQIDIVKLLNISSSTVNRIIMSDTRYTEEKNLRQNANKAKNKKETIQYITKIRKQKSNDIDYECMKKQHIEASMELSGGVKPIPDRAFRNWNTSAYRFNEKTKCYILRNGITAGIDVPKKINWKN